MNSDASNGSNTGSSSESRDIDEHDVLDEYTIMGMAKRLGIDRNAIYRWLRLYEHADRFKASANARDGGKYYPRDEWSALLSRYGHEYPDSSTQNGRSDKDLEIFEAELLDPDGDETGGSLALLSESNKDLDDLIQGELAKVDTLMKKSNQTEADISQEELRKWRKQGFYKGAVRFRVTEEAEELAFEKLRRQKIEGDGQDAQ